MSSTARRFSLSLAIFLLNPLCRCLIGELACFISSMTSSKNSLFIPTLLVRKWTACFRFSLRSAVHLYCAILWYYSPSSLDFVKSLMMALRQSAVTPQENRGENWHNNLINLETAWGNLPSQSCVIRCWRVTPAYQDTGLVRTYATLFRSGRTVSCIPIAFRTALRLLSSGLPFGESVR